MATQILNGENIEARLATSAEQASLETLARNKNEIKRLIEQNNKLLAGLPQKCSLSG